jgi:hypothetical protein
MVKPRRKERALLNLQAKQFATSARIDPESWRKNSLEIPGFGPEPACEKHGFAEKAH